MLLKIVTGLWQRPEECANGCAGFLRTHLQQKVWAIQSDYLQQRVRLRRHGCSPRGNELVLACLKIKDWFLHAGKLGRDVDTEDGTKPGSKSRRRHLGQGSRQTCTKCSSGPIPHEQR